LTNFYNKPYGWYDSLFLKNSNPAYCHSRSGVASYFIARGVSSLIDRLSKHLQDKSVSANIDKLVHYIIIAAGFFIALGVLI
jgi:hypothetical protein